MLPSAFPLQACSHVGGGHQGWGSAPTPLRWTALRHPRSSPHPLPYKPTAPVPPPTGGT